MAGNFFPAKVPLARQKVNTNFMVYYPPVFLAAWLELDFMFSVRICCNE
jgi:hypothetical protein